MTKLVLGAFGLFLLTFGLVSAIVNPTPAPTAEELALAKRRIEVQQKIDLYHEATRELGKRLR